MTQESKSHAKPIAVPAPEDLSSAIEQAVERAADEEVRSVRVFADHYRCNWWVRDKRVGAPSYLDGGKIRRSRFLRVTRSEEKQLLIEDLSDRH